MKRIFHVLFWLVAVIMVTSIYSCKKGEGDPFISFISRKNRMAGEWKVSSLTSQYKYANRVIETTFSSGAKKETFTVKDTTPAFSTTVTSHGNINIDYQKDGNYTYSETFKDDSTGTVVTTDATGLWYFMGKNKEMGYKDKELLAMQVLTNHFNPNLTGDYSSIYQGENSLDMYQIYELKNDEIILKVEKTETIDFVKYSTTLEMTLVPR
jgi:hypothetical protein